MSRDLGFDCGAEALAEARAWLGTPYRHQASVKGWGCDCVGLVRGVWRALYGPEPEPMPPYRPDWAEVTARETLRDGARRWLLEHPLAQARPGDVLLFRMAPDACIKHCAILSAAPTAADPHARMIHAYWGRAVVESWIGPWWRRRAVAAFGWPSCSVQEECVMPWVALDMDERAKEPLEAVRVYCPPAALPR